MKILQVNSVYAFGSTGKITHDLHKGLLQRGLESVVCYGRRENTEDKGVYRLCPDWYGKANNLWSRITGTMYGGCYWSTMNLINIIKREKPDIVHLQCINGYFVNIYRLIHWLNKNKIRTVLTLHAEFMYTANCGYALDCEKWRSGCGNCPRLKQETLSWGIDGTARSFEKMRKAFHGFENELTVVSVSPWLEERASSSPILFRMDHRTVLNGLDTKVFSKKNSTEAKQKLGIQDEKIVFHVTAQFSDDPNHLKGGYHFLELCKRFTDLPVKFIVAGPCQLNNPVPENVILLGQVQNQEELATYYSMADLVVVTSKKETFSMVCAESLCCGTPIVGFRAGAPEKISLPQYSRFVNPGDMDELETVVKEFLYDSELQSDLIADDAKKEYAKERMLDQYISLYQEVVK